MKIASNTFRSPEDVWVDNYAVPCSLIQLTKLLVPYYRGKFIRENT